MSADDVLPACRITRHKYEFSDVSTILLLPVVPTIVVGTTGAIVAQGLTTVSLHYALLTTLAGVTLIGIGLTISTFFMFLYLGRLLLHGFPEG